jgi:hypothetical protein
MAAIKRRRWVSTFISHDCNARPGCSSWLPLPLHTMLHNVAGAPQTCTLHITHHTHACSQAGQRNSLG